MKGSTSYRDVGVLTNEEFDLGALLAWVRRTEEHRRGRAGQSAMDVGYFASVIDLGNGLGLALTTDGVGTKILVAERMEKYDTIGIDCVAMNVNDLICVGAEPLTMLDYIAVEKADPAVLEQIGRGLHEGARQAQVNIVGGEISQTREIIRGVRPGGGIDLVGMCVGTVPLAQVNQGDDVRPGDVILGLRSSGIHCNGLTLARKVLFDGIGADVRVPELGRTTGEELLEPTRIYVREVRALLEAGLPVKAMANITSDGLLNLTRIRPAVGFEIDSLPAPQPVFDLIQRTGKIDDAEMYRVFNMGIGFCLICADDAPKLQAIRDLLEKHDLETFVLGRVVEDADRRVLLKPKGLVGRGDRFHPA